MNRFAALLDALAFEPSRNAKIRLIVDYFRTTPDPDRGYALAALTDALSFRYAKPGLIKTLIAERVDPHLFELSYDYVGDLSETVALLWPSPERADVLSPSLSAVIRALMQAGASELPRLLTGLLDGLDETGRWALLKLITRALRIGVSARLAKQALADFGDKPVHDIEDVWHGLEPPYLDLFAWLEGREPKPETSNPAPFHAAMLAHALEETDMAALPLDAFSAEWKWDGIRIQACGGVLPDGRRIVRLYSRTGEDISGAFPDLVEELLREPVASFALDGELLIVRDAKTQAFGVLQQRLNRKTVSAKLLTEFPAHIRAYDLLSLDGEDLRPLPFDERRRRLDAFVSGAQSDRLDLSPQVAASSWEALAAARREPAMPMRSKASC
jgi:DNA ligase-1